MPLPPVLMHGVFNLNQKSQNESMTIDQHNMLDLIKCENSGALHNILLL